MSLAAIIVVGLAAYRITRALTSDTITDPLRAVLYGWAWDLGAETKSRGKLRGWVYELATCAHCLGFWVSLGAVALWAALGSAPSGIAGWIIAVFAVAAVQSLSVSVVTKLGD